MVRVIFGVTDLAQDGPTPGAMQLKSMINCRKIQENNSVDFYTGCYAHFTIKKEGKGRISSRQNNIEVKLKKMSGHQYCAYTLSISLIIALELDLY